MVVQYDLIEIGTEDSLSGTPWPISRALRPDSTKAAVKFFSVADPKILTTWFSKLISTDFTPGSRTCPVKNDLLLYQSEIV